MPHSISKNALLMTMASVGQKVIAFVYFTIIARTIGVEGTGKYFFALSFTTIFVVFVDMGFTNVLVREAARSREKMQDYVSAVFGAKLILGVLAYLAAVLAIRLFGYPEEIRQLVYLSALTMLFDSLHLTAYGALRALGVLSYEAIGVLGSQLLTLILGSFFLSAGLPLVFLILAFTIPSFFNACFAVGILSKKYGIAAKPAYHRETLRRFIRIAIPFAVAAVAARFYSYADTIILSKMMGNTAVGWYSIAYKITFAFQFIPLSLVAALYPRFSEFYAHDRTRLAFILEQSIRYLLVIVLPIVVGISVLAEDIILSLYTPEYIAAVRPLQILLVGLIFSFVSFPIGAFLNACNRQTTQTMIVVGVLVLNVCLNLLLIPRFGVVGAAAAACVGNALLALFGYIFIPRIAPIAHARIAKFSFQVLCISLLMGWAVWRIHQGAHYGVAIIGGVLAYTAMIFLTGAVTREELKSMLLFVRK